MPKVTVVEQLKFSSWQYATAIVVTSGAIAAIMYFYLEKEFPEKALEKFQSSESGIHFKACVEKNMFHSSENLGDDLNIHHFIKIVFDCALPILHKLLLNYSLLLSGLTMLAAVTTKALTGTATFLYKNRRANSNEPLLICNGIEYGAINSPDDSFKKSCS